MKKTVTFLATLIVAVGAQAACYTVLGPKGKVLSESATPPVDMAYQLHQTVPYAYGQGATMVFGIADARCGQELDRYYDLQTGSVEVETYQKVRTKRGFRYVRRVKTVHNKLDMPLTSASGSNTPVLVSGTYGTSDGVGSSYGGTSGSHDIVTGPRGGRYFVNGSGGKTYVGKGR